MGKRQADKSEVYFRKKKNRERPPSFLVVSGKPKEAANSFQKENHSNVRTSSPPSILPALEVESSIGLPLESAVPNEQHLKVLTETPTLSLKAACRFCNQICVGTSTLLILKNEYSLTENR